MRNVGVVIGSLRKESFTRKIANAVVELAPPQLSLSTIEIADLPLYNQDLDPTPPAEWERFRDRIRAVDAVLFATPEYNRGVPGVLKNAVDVGSRPYGKNAWAGRPAGVIGVSPGALGAFGAVHHLRQSLVFIDMPCMQAPELYIGGADKLLDKSGKLASTAVRDLLTRYLIAFVTWIEHNTPAASQAAA